MLLPGWEGRTSDHKFDCLRRGQYRAVLPVPNNAVYVKHKQGNAINRERDAKSMGSVHEHTVSWDDIQSFNNCTFNIEITILHKCQKNKDVL
jgi:hypothetical protein